MLSETEIAADEFVNALAKVLQASRSGTTSIGLRSRRAPTRSGLNMRPPISASVGRSGLDRQVGLGGTARPHKLD
jgi:hypothetical protein